MTKRLAPLATLLLLLAAPCLALAQGSRIDVNPTRLDLATQRSGIITLRNDGVEPVRFEVFLYAWAQSETGEMQLTETDDLAHYPSILEIAPGASRPVRIGVVERATGAEASYRLLVKQLPAQKQAASGTAVQVLTNLSIPIFVAPPSARSAPRVAIDPLEKNRFALRLENAGTRSFRASRLLVRAFGEDAKPIHEEEIAAWYVLAGGLRRYEIELPAAVCSRLRKLAVVAEIPGETNVEVERPLTCGT